MESLHLGYMIFLEGNLSVSSYSTGDFSTDDFLYSDFSVTLHTHKCLN